MSEHEKRHSEDTPEEWLSSYYGSSIDHLGHERKKSEANSATELLRRDATSSILEGASEDDKAQSSASPGRDNDRNSMIEDVLGGPLRHLGRPASQSSLTAQRNRRSRVLTPIAEQRHPGKEGLKISKFTRTFEPDLREEDESTVEDSQMSTEKGSADEGFLSGWPLSVLIVGLCLAVFLISIDRTIITTVRSLRLFNQDFS